MTTARRCFTRTSHGLEPVGLPRELVIGLIEAVEALAETRLIDRAEMWLAEKTTYCRECFYAGLGGGPIRHAASCCVGQAVMAARLLREAMNAAAPVREADGGPFDLAAQWRELFKQASAEAARTLRDMNAITDLAVAKLRAHESQIAQLEQRLAEVAPSAPVPVPRGGMEANFAEGAPVRQIVYDVCGVDAAAGSPGPEQVLVYEDGNDYARVATHEEAATFRGDVFRGPAE